MTIRCAYRRPVPSRLLTREQVAEELGVSPWVVYSLIRRGRLPAIRIGTRGWWRVSREDLEVYIGRTEREAEEPALSKKDAPED
jgi:excisionase family DNA binding protein